MAFSAASPSIRTPPAWRTWLRRRHSRIPEVDAVATEKNLRWYALGGVAWRSLALSIMVVVSWGELSEEPQLPMAAGLTVAANLGMLGLVVRNRAAAFLQSTAYFAVDVGGALALTLWASAVMPEHTVYLQNRDLFNPYLWGTMMLWTGLRSIRTGLVILVAAALPVQWAMAWLNGYSVTEPGWLNIAARDLWLVTSFIISAIVAALSWEAAYAGAETGFKAGRIVELRSLHDSVLQTLKLIRLDVTDTQTSAEERLRAIHEKATSQAEDIATVLAALDGRAAAAHSSLGRELRDLVVEFRPRRLTVELVADELADEPTAPVTEAVRGAVREALMNVVKHAGASRAVVRLASRDGGIRVTVRDQGVGYDAPNSTAGFGISHSIVGRMERVGGTAEIVSAPGGGTKVKLWVPTRAVR